MLNRLIYKKTTLACLAFILLSLLGAAFYGLLFGKASPSDKTQQSKAQSSKVKTARVMANEIFLSIMVFMAVLSRLMELMILNLSLSMPKTGFQVQIWQLVTTREQSVQIIR